MSCEAHFCMRHFNNVSTWHPTSHKWSCNYHLFPKISYRSDIRSKLKKKLVPFSKGWKFPNSEISSTSKILILKFIFFSQQLFGNCFPSGGTNHRGLESTLWNYSQLAQTLEKPNQTERSEKMRKLSDFSEVYQNRPSWDLGKRSMAICIRSDIMAMTRFDYGWGSY